MNSQDSFPLAHTLAEPSSDGCRIFKRHFMTFSKSLCTSHIWPVYQEGPGAAGLLTGPNQLLAVGEAPRAVSPDRTWRAFYNRPISFLVDGGIAITRLNCPGLSLAMGEQQVHR